MPVVAEVEVPLNTYSQYGLPCPSCGCTEHRVYYTRPKLGSLKRRRFCTGCGEGFTTRETIVNDGFNHTGGIESEVNRTKENGSEAAESAE